MVVLKDRRTVNANLYNIVFLPEIIPEFRKQSMQRLIAHPHDSESLHQAFQSYQLSEARRN